jgi:DNA processing protein
MPLRPSRAWRSPSRAWKPTMAAATTTGTADTSPSERERAYWVALNRTPGIGVVRFRLLLERFGSLEAAWHASLADLTNAGLDRRSLDALQSVRSRTNPERELERVGRAGARVVTWPDEEYPALLATIPDPPPVLYVKGSLTPHVDQAVAMVGTRRATVYGRDLAERFAQELAAGGTTIVSGLAKGIDTHAHIGALKGAGRTVAVLGHGIDTCYPPENRRLAAQIVESGALVSDYPIGTGPMAENFPPRNRIISGLSAGVIVVEAGEGSGALITSRYALDQGRDVFAVPGPVTSPASRGCHRLIQDGAKLVTCGDDVLEELNPHLAAAAVRQLSFDWGAHPAGEAVPGLPSEIDGASDEALVRLLGEAGQPVHADALCRRLGRPVHQVTGTLTLLELQGRVRHVGGMRYELAR